MGINHSLVLCVRNLEPTLPFISWRFSCNQISFREKGSHKLWSRAIISWFHTSVYQNLLSHVICCLWLFLIRIFHLKIAVLEAVYPTESNGSFGLRKFATTSQYLRIFQTVRTSNYWSSRCDNRNEVMVLLLRLEKGHCTANPTFHFQSSNFKSRILSPAMVMTTRVVWKWAVVWMVMTSLWSEKEGVCKRSQSEFCNSVHIIGIKRNILRFHSLNETRNRWKGVVYTAAFFLQWMSARDNSFTARIPRRNMKACMPKHAKQGKFHYKWCWFKSVVVWLKK